MEVRRDAHESGLYLAQNNPADALARANYKDLFPGFQQGNNIDDSMVICLRKENAEDSARLYPGAQWFTCSVEEMPAGARREIDASTKLLFDAIRGEADNVVIPFLASGGLLMRETGAEMLRKLIE